MKRLICCLACVVALVPLYGSAVTGNSYQRLSQSLRYTWIVGVTEGILTVQLFEANQNPPFDKNPPIVRCLNDLEAQQIQAIFEKALKNNPEKWQFPASYLFYQTFHSYCAK
jgi:hypothetical protein